MDTLSRSIDAVYVDKEQKTTREWSRVLCTRAFASRLILMLIFIPRFHGEKNLRYLVI